MKTLAIAIFASVCTYGLAVLAATAWGRRG